LAAHTIAQSHSDGALRGVLPDDIFVEFGDDFARRHVVQCGQKFLLASRGSAVGAGHENDLFIGLAGHSSFRLFLLDA
jgi:hypothetical protein